MAGQRVDRIAEVLLITVGSVVLAVAWVAVPDASVTLAVLVGWNVIAFGYIAVQWLRIHRSRRTSKEVDTGVPDWVGGKLGRTIGLAGTLVTSVAGVTGGLLVVAADAAAQDGDLDSTLLFFLKLCGALAVIAAWILLHLGYAGWYAYLFYRSEAAGGLEFPATNRPNHLDFAYFSFTPGTSFAVSDVQIQARPLRYAALTHGVLSFFYNAALVGIAVNALAGK
ncbi:DUF1345 domain-containing protein [Fodinicola feengrottensis]|uniref:DUF1345 domain-containing protein n=1 Tax=Fodinicola feengrottensis TaxID=435914 RepID=UPI0013D6BFC0|nr:DUF1345 domain-containing protein [Fodinicola feengrottensis]